MFQELSDESIKTIEVSQSDRYHFLAALSAH